MHFAKINEKSEQVRNKALTNEHLGYIILMTNKRSKKGGGRYEKTFTCICAGSDS